MAHRNAKQTKRDPHQHVVFGVIRFLYKQKILIASDRIDCLQRNNIQINLKLFQKRH